MKILKFLSQLIIGGVFIFSGFVKIVDPVGGYIKLEEYLSAFQLGFIEPIAIFISVLLAAIEFLIGIHILLGTRLKIASWGAFIFMSFFTILTFYSAIAEPVSDCGCFGDAWKLTNWETFFKNLILLPFSIFLFQKRNSYTEKISLWRINTLTILFGVFILSISWYSYKHLPIIDFRPYHIGADIRQDMSIPENAEQPEYETVFILEKDGVQKEFDVNNYPYEDSTWVFIDSKSTLIKEGYVPPINDFSLQTINGDIVTSNILDEESPVLLVIIPRIEEAGTAGITTLINLHLKQKEWNYKMFILTSSIQKELFRFDSNVGIDFDYLIGDDTVLKTMIRANPGIIVLYKGTILYKWNFNDIKSVNMFRNPVSIALYSHNVTRNFLTISVLALILISIILLFYKQNKLN